MLTQACQICFEGRGGSDCACFCSFFFLFWGGGGGGVGGGEYMLQAKALKSQCHSSSAFTAASVSSRGSSWTDGGPKEIGNFLVQFPECPHDIIIPGKQ